MVAENILVIHDLSALWKSLKRYFRLEISRCRLAEIGSEPLASPLEFLGICETCDLEPIVLTRQGDPQLEVGLAASLRVLVRSVLSQQDGCVGLEIEWSQRLVLQNSFDVLL